MIAPHPASTLSLAALQPPGAGTSRSLVLNASVVINLLSLALPLVILHVYDRVLPYGSLPTLLVLSLGLAIALVLDAALRACRSVVSTRVGAGVEHALRVALVERLLETPLTAAEHDPMATHVDRLAAVGILRYRYSGEMAATLMDLPFAALYLLLIAVIGGWLVAVPLAVVALFALGRWGLSRELTHAVSVRAEGDGRRHAFLLDLLGGLGSVKALALDEPLLRCYERFQEDSADAVRAVAWYGALAQALGGLAGQANIVALMAVGAAMVLDGTLTAGQLAACTLLTGRALQPVQAAMALWTMMHDDAVARAKVEAGLTLPAEAAEAGPEAEPRFTGAVELRDITFHPDGRDAPLFDRLSLALRPGEAVAIRGSIGSGKTALLLTMLGLIRPQGGEVLADGEVLTEASARRLRRQAALLPQRGGMFEGTLLDNLTGFRNGEIANEAMYLAYLLGLDAMVRRLPDGYATIVGGATGGALTVGVRQQVAIIRALVGQPRLILFDEANLPLDSANGRRLRDLLAGMKSSTALVLTGGGDADFLALADRRLTLAGGKLVPGESS